MPVPQRTNYQTQRQYGEVKYYKSPIKKTRPKKVKKKKPNPLQALFRFVFLSLFAYFVLPYNYLNYVEPMYVNPYRNRAIKADMSQYVNTILNYTANTELFGQNLYVDEFQKSKKMSPIVSSGTLLNTKAQLENLFSAYPNMKPHVFVWEYQSAKSFEFNADDKTPAASIIKIPVLFELMRKIDREKASGTNLTSLDKKIFYTNMHKTEGSGKLQYSQLDRFLTVDYLARIMITQSDNSATNMLIEEIGGINAFNSSMRTLGFDKIRINDWLPDLAGTNTLSARQLATLLYNLDNPKYLSRSASTTIKEYMGNVENRSLLKAGLPNEALIVHKTGDIGKMLGDAGIVYTQNGKKYIVVTMVERPHNDYTARDLIQKASKIIYNNINSGLDI